MGRSPAPPAIKRLPLSRRLVAVVLTAVGTGMIVSAAVSVWQESLQFVDGRREVLQATAQAFSAAAANAAASRDASGALAAIRAIGNVPGILYAEVRTAEGATLATLGSAPRLIGDVTLDGDESIFALFTSRTVLVSAPIVHGGEPAGRLILIGGTEGLWARLLGSVAITAFGGLMALIVGLAVGWRFQRGIAQPLQRLIAATAQVREQHRYDIALQADGDREVGQLIDGFNAMLSDIKERDARLEAHRRNLERDVADRTRDLRDARDAADAANRAKSDFLATMSHEIRTPMNGIMVMAELLAKEEMPPRQRRCADVIVNSGQSLLAIINDILDFSKIEAGKLELEAVPVDLAQQADTTITLFAERARSKGIDLAAFVDPTTPRMITGDPVRMTQVIGNLINNALKFTEQGCVHLQVAPAAGRPGVLSIAVKDSGIGIPADKVATIFDAFSQADQSTTRQYGGTGLGLAICKRLVAAWGGEIDVASTAGQGSTFTVTVPFDVVDAASNAHDWPRLEPGPTSPLCVLDLTGEATVATASRYFGASGYVVTGAAGRDYSDAALICADAERLRISPLDRHDRKPIIIAVADFGDASADQLVADGLADAVLTRPLLRADVEDLLARIVSGGPLVARSEAAVRERDAMQFPGLKVLVADDSAVNREVASAALARLGASVQTVENGAQAIAAARGQSFDVILMDGSMPDIDGFAAARAIREEEQREGRERLPIVALTAHVIGKAAGAWRDAGMDDIIHKPFTLGQLGACLQRLFPDWVGSCGSMDIEPVATDAAIAAEGDQLLDAGVLHDLEEIAGSTGGDFVRRIFNLYIENAPRIRTELARAVDEGDREASARAAHALKSMSHNVGARRVAASAEAIERHARETGVPPSEDLQALSRLLEQTIESVRARLEPGSPQPVQRRQLHQG